MTGRVLFDHVFDVVRLKCLFEFASGYQEFHLRQQVITSQVLC